MKILSIKKEGDKMPFVHLEVITTNSLMKSTLTVEELVLNAKEKNYKAIALTDRNVLYGAIEFYELAKKHGIKPIIGLTLDVQGYQNKKQAFPLILLAKNKKGYHNLLQLSTKYQLSDKKYVELPELIKRADDLIVISPDEDSEIVAVIDHAKEEVKELTDYYNSVFPHFYQGISLQAYDPNQIEIIKKLDLPTIALGNVRYLNSEDDLPSRVLQILDSDFILQGDEQERINYYLSRKRGDYSLQSAEQTYQLFKEVALQDAADETINVANQVSTEISIGQHFMPTFLLDEGQTADGFLRELCEKNLEKRVKKVTTKYTKRLNKELKVISDMGFSDYFLIVWDIMIFAHSQNIYTGSGRGSAAGSLVAYLLKITNVDPIEFDLLFERFLNKDRASLPDIDLDFPDNRREEILNYILKKYGPENVSQIGTIGKFGAKSAVRDVGRVFGLSQEKLRGWAQALPSSPNVTLDQAKNNKNIKDLVNKNDLNRTIYQTALKIEGSNRHISTHAAGVVVSDQKLIERVPLQKGNSDMYLTQYTMDAVEKVGLLKLDILGLRNLSTLADCLRFIPYENNGQAIDIDSIPFDDSKTLSIFQKGNTDGVFQFESSGIRQQLRKLKPSSFEDIVAVNALYRPGPMQQIDTFIKRKHGQEKIQYPHDDLKDILENTYGIIVYQEQVMKVATRLAGYTLNEADILRRAIGNKDHQAIEEGRQEFIKGALQNNYSEETAINVYNYIERFADYGFNRSHAVAYSKVAYQLAYVKANYPASFFASIMKTSSKEKMKTYLSEAKFYDIEIIAPDINKSFYSFIIEDGNILSGFNMIKGLARDFIQEIINERKNNGQYLGLIDFVKRIDSRWLTEKQLLPLIHSGSMDCLEKNRNSVIHSLTNVLENVQMSHGNETLIQLFSPKIIEKEALSDDEKMQQEFESTGFYFTAEPGEQYKELRKNKNIIYISEIANQKKVKLLLLIKNIKKIQTKNGKPMSFIDAVDTSGKINLTLFPEIHRRYIQKIGLDDTIVVEGDVSEDSRGTRLLVNQLIKADKLKEKSENEKNKNQIKKVLYLRFESLVDEENKFRALKKILKNYPGISPVNIYDKKTGKQKFLNEDYQVDVESKAIKKLEKMFGHQNLIIKDIKINKK